MCCAALGFCMDHWVALKSTTTVGAKGREQNKVTLHIFCCFRPVRFGFRLGLEDALFVPPHPHRTCNILECLLHKRV